MPARRINWTPEQEKRLKALAESGASAIRISAALNRPMNGIRMRARQLGIELKTIREIRAKLRDTEG